MEKWGNIHFMAAYFLCQYWATRDGRLEDFIKILRVHSCRVAAHTHTRKGRQQDTQLFISAS